jgi:DNA relaxase NicK
MDSVESLEAGIDWFSGTMHIEGGNVVQWREAAMELLRERITDGNKVEARSLYGYEGFWAGGAFVGSSQERIYVQFSGTPADAAFKRLYSDDMHLARLDLQVTARFRVYTADVVNRAYEGANAINLTLPNSRRRKLVVYSGNDGGATLYIGSPTSEQRCRIYNKEIQSERPEYERCWRYEVVLRNDYAGAMGKALRARPQAHTAVICDAVGAWIAQRGVSPPWTVRDAANAVPRVRRDPTDTERALWWLSSQVRPTVQQLIAKGFADVVHSILFGDGEWAFSKPSKRTK